MSYPLPAAAVSVWKAGEEIWMALPGPLGRGHCIHFPATPDGAIAMLRVLAAREREELQAQSHRIATEGTPTNAQVQALINKRIRDREARAARAEAEANKPPREYRPRNKTKAKADNLASFLVDLGLV